MKYARIKSGVVAEIIPDYAVPPEKWYGAVFAAKCVQAPDDTTVGMLYNSETNTFTAPSEDIESVRAAKLSEISTTAQAAIVAGCDVTLSGGTTGHISLTPEDQINLTTAQAVVKAGATGYPYHLDGQLCAIYPAEDIMAMATAAVNHILYHTTYCNHMLTWARRATTADELAGITYGAALPEDLAANLEAVLAAAGAGTNG